MLNFDVEGLDIEKLVEMETRLEGMKHEYTVDEYLMHKMRLKQLAIGKDPTVVSLDNFRKFGSRRTNELGRYTERYFQYCADRLLAGEWVHSYAIQVARRLRDTNRYHYQFTHILLRVIDGKTLISNGSRKWLKQGE